MMNDFQSLFTRRLLLLAGFKVSLLSVLVGRLYYLQILKGSHYKILSDKNHLQSNLIEPSRGLIFDRTGVILAGHKTSYRVYLAPDLTKQPLVVLEKTSKILNFSDPKFEKLIQQFKKSRKTKLLIKEDLTWEELSTIEIHSQELQGILIDKGEKRYYPYPKETCHIIGYVADVSKKEQVSDDPLLQLPGFRIGKTGIEKSQNQTLQGSGGIKHVAVDAYGRIAQTLEVFDPKRGENLSLSLDIKLQQEVAKILEPHLGGGAVVMDVHTGAIRALVSQPAFNAQIFTDGISKEVWRDISSNPFFPLVNKITQGQYSPGSLFKLMVALAGLHEGVIDPHNTFYCNGKHDLNGHLFHCWNWKQGGHGTVNVSSAISKSCDVFFYQLASKLGIDKIAAVAKDFGFGTITGIDLPGEGAGLVPTKEWKRKAKNQAWTGGDTINISIGQGFLLSTPLQHAKMLAMLCNGLKPIVPHLINKDVSESSPLHYDPAHIEIILQGMNDVVNSPFGTAHLSKIPLPNFSMGGKTASTQVSRITLQQRKDGTHNDHDYATREHAMFVAFAPVENPQFVVSVIIEHGGGGAKVAAPVARDIAMAAHALGIGG